MMRFRSEAVEQARSADIVATAAALGARLRRVTASEMAGPCPTCGGRDRFAINLLKRLWSCRGCGAGGDAIGLVRHVHGFNFKEAIAFLTGENATPAPTRQAAEKCNVDGTFAPKDGDNREKALALWREAGDPRQTIVERYLNSRALALDNVAGHVIRWHPRIGAMVALFRNIETIEPQAISRTFLDRQGKKLGRRFLGPVAGAAIMLDTPDQVLEGLHIGEGVETCMAARLLGLRPVWALGSAAAVAAFPVLGGVECLTLLRENDGASERACEACAARWHAAGREVFINEPIAGKDLNDALRGTP